MARVAGMIPADDARALQQLADRNERSVGAELRLAIREHLRQNGHRGR